MERLRQWWPIGVAVLFFAGDVAVSQYRLDLMDDRLVKIEESLSPSAFSDYAVLKERVSTLRDDMQTVRTRLWQLEKNSHTHE